MNFIKFKNVPIFPSVRESYTGKFAEICDRMLSPKFFHLRMNISVR